MSIPSMTFDERYRAISGRDRRFDGQFVTAVRSTGIYCRPSCPARTPKSSNVSFFVTSAAAHEAGYRACKRCLPEAAPGSPEWNSRGDLVGRAMRLIADGVVEREGVTGLSARLGYSPRHLTRVLGSELGAGPLALARAQRAHTARMLLVGTDIPASDVAFAAGFRSIRQFNDTIREVFALTPVQLRQRGTDHSHVPVGAVELILPYRRPLDIGGIFTWMAQRAIHGVEVATAESLSRHLRLAGGPAWFEVRKGDDARIHLRARVTVLGDLGSLVARVRRVFDLDADPVAIDAALSEHQELVSPVGAIPGIRVPGATDPHEMLIRAMVGQQISVPAARTALTRLTEALGEPVDGGMLFPAMAAIAAHGESVLGGPASRIRAIVNAAHVLASGQISLSSGDDSAEQRATLLALPGVGPWTADYVRMRVLGDPDVLLPGDLVVRKGAKALDIPHDPTSLGTWARRVAPWQSYLTAHLWRAAPSIPRKSDAS